MRPTLLVEAVDGTVDDPVEVIGVGKGSVGKVVPLEVAPAMLDGVEFGRILGQPLEREPRPLGKSLGRALARMDRPDRRCRSVSMTTTSGLVRSL